MNRKKIRLFIVGLLILSVTIMSGCAKEETPMPIPVPIPTPKPGPSLEPTQEPSPEPTPAKAPPVAQISATPSTAKLGESITFSGAASTDSDGNITSYQWDFDDGYTASGESVTHTYSDRGGTYYVILTVSDSDAGSNKMDSCR